MTSPLPLDERRRRVATLTTAGYTALEIAIRLNCTSRTISRDRKALGIDKPKPELLTPDELHRAAQLLDDGCSYNEVGRTIGRHPNTISRHFPGRGWNPNQAAEYSALIRTPNRRRTCTIDGCRNPHQARGMCNAHYARARAAKAAA